MKARFFRKTSFFVTSQTLDSKRQGFLFHLSLGFQGAPDLETGMITSLTEVDQFLRDHLPRTSKATSRFIFYKKLRNLLLKKLLSRGLVQIELKDQSSLESWLWKNGKDFLSLEEAVHLPDERSLASPALVRIYFQVEDQSVVPAGLRVTFLGVADQVYEEGECP